MIRVAAAIGFFLIGILGLCSSKLLRFLLPKEKETTPASAERHGPHFKLHQVNIEAHQCGNTTTWCPDSRECCPANYSPTNYGCRADDFMESPHPNPTITDDSTMCCKPGPELPPSSELPNCLILGDSVSIGYTPHVQEILKTKCQVQHAPWDTRDGGAGSTAEALPCLENFLKTQHQLPVAWDVILFNFGLHNLEDQTPQRQAVYRDQLTKITQRLLEAPTTNATSNHDHDNTPPKLIYATTTPYMPLASLGVYVVDELNRIALEIMKSTSSFDTDIDILDLNELVHSHCGTNYTTCDWCNTNPCSYHYNDEGKKAQGRLAAAAIQKVLPPGDLRQSLLTK